VWLHMGILDRAFPMIYSAKDDQVADDLAAWVRAAPATRVTPGLGAYLHAPGQTQRQIERATLSTSSGYAMFAYAGFFESVDPNQDKSEKARAERTARLEAFRTWLAASEKNK